MNYERTKEHKMIGQAVREFVSKELTPIVPELDEEERFPMEVFKNMGDLGFLGLILPEEYGGGGPDYFGAAVVGEELAKVCPGFHTSVHGHVFCAHWIDLFGTPEQKRKYLPGLATAESIGAIAITEPNAGSDVGAAQTFAAETDEGFILNGNKIFISNGPIADVIVVVAATDDESKPRGISTFILETKTPGFTSEMPMKKLGNRVSPTSEIILKDLFLPKENLLGTKHKGLAETTKLLTFERVLVAVACGGIAEKALHEARGYALGRKQFGKPIAHFQSIQHMMADVAAEIFATKSMAYRVLEQMEQGQYPVAEAAMAKLFGAEMVMRATTAAIQILGGYGYTREFPVEKLFRDAKVYSIGGGTSQIQRGIIAADLLSKG